jgi:hypothetical protein
MDFRIYLIPFAMATLAKFCVLAAIGLPGGARGVFALAGAIACGANPRANSCPSWPIKSGAAGAHIRQTSDDAGREERRGQKPKLICVRTPGKA